MCFCQATLDNLLLMRHLQEVNLELPGFFRLDGDIIIRNVIRRLQTLHEREGGMKRLCLFYEPPSSSTPPYQTITVPPGLLP